MLRPTGVVCLSVRFTDHPHSVAGLKEKGESTGKVGK